MYGLIITCMLHEAASLLDLHSAPDSHADFLFQKDASTSGVEDVHFLVLRIRDVAMGHNL